MKLNDAITQANALRPSEVTRATMISWLATLDGQIWQNIISQYEDHEPDEMPAYDPSGTHTNPDTVLLIPAPYDLLYLDYLVMRVDLINADYERYNNDAIQYNEQYQAYVNWYNREHVHSRRVSRPEDHHYATWIKF